MGEGGWLRIGFSLYGPCAGEVVYGRWRVVMRWVFLYGAHVCGRGRMRARRRVYALGFRYMERVRAKSYTGKSEWLRFRFPHMERLQARSYTGEVGGRA